MAKKFMAFRIIAGVICLYHVALGIVLNCPGDVIQWAVSNCMGATKLPDASSLFVAKMLGAYMIFFGLGMGLVAWNPIKNRSILTIGALLVIFRSIHRIIQADLLMESLGISTQSNWTTIIILIIFSVALLAFRFLLLADSKKTLSPNVEL